MGEDVLELKSVAWDPARSLRVGIVGCGRVASHHARFIKEQAGVELAAVADVDEATAGSFAAQHGVGGVYTSLERMLDEARLDVLHVLSPPRFHVPHALIAVERGVHTLVEKPLALEHADAERLFEAASRRRVLVCPDFIHLYHPRVLEARAVIESGRLGRVIHVDCFMGVDLDIAELREANGLHWSYRLPGGVLHNYFTHALYLTLSWIGDVEDVRVTTRALGSQPQALTDHLDITMAGQESTAHVTVSLTTRPAPFTVRIFCERGTVLVDIDRLTLSVDGPSALPRTVSRVMSPVSQGWQLVTGAGRNVVDRLRGRLVPYPGLRQLISLLYRGVREGGESPVSPRLALAVSRAEQAVLDHGAKVHVDLTSRPGRQARVQRSERVLVTGASGYLGREVVHRLVSEGYAVRVLARPLSRIEGLEALGVEICFGDLRDRECLQSAATTMDVVVHLGAALRGSGDFMHATAVDGTRNIAEAAAAGGARHVVYVSSMAVYDFLALRDGDVIGPDSPLEPAAQERGKASAAKRDAEDVALEQLRRGAPPWTILRPSVFFGNGHDSRSLVGFTRGRWLICTGRRRRRLRLVHVKDVAAAILLAIENPRARGRIYTVSHPETVTLGEYVRTCIQRDGAERTRVIYIPHAVAYSGMLVARALARLAGIGFGFNKRRIAYLYRDVLVDASRIQHDLNWVPVNGLRAELNAETLNAGLAIGRHVRLSSG
jgi:predicted dehydrogenase/nucleoside-diphosphate-sugar epimerase